VEPWLVLGAGLVVASGAFAAAVLAARRLRQNSERPTPLAEIAFPADVQERELLQLILRAAMRETDADAAAVAVRATGRAWQFATANLGEAESTFLLDRLVTTDETAARREDYIFEEMDGTLTPVKSGVLLARSGDNATVGLGVYWRREASTADRQAVIALDLLARGAQPVVERTFEQLEPRLSAPLEVAEERRLRHLGSFSASIEVAEVLRTLLELALAEAAADAVAAAVTEPAVDRTIVVSAGVSPAEEEWLRLTIAGDVKIAAIGRYIDVHGQTSDASEISTTVLVPLYDRDGDAVGAFVCAWRRDLAHEADQALAVLSALAANATDVIDTAIRMERLRHAAIRDPQTKLLNRRYFFGALESATEEARMRGDPLTLILAVVALDAATVPETLDQREETLLRAASTFAKTIGDAGDSCVAGIGEFAALLFGSSALHTAALTNKLEDASQREGFRWTIVAGRYHPPETPDEFFGRVRAALTTQMPS
jgi:GGDEF domain-containing protein